MRITAHSASPAPAKLPWKPQRMIYGGDYNPEQWPESIWMEDMRLMQEAGVNLVSLGVFAWSRLEPRAGIYDFAWLDRVMDLLHTHGIQVNLATATASPPPWMAKLHPETLLVTSDGTTLWPGSRRHNCPHSKAYREAATRLVTLLAQRYHDHPALAMWHIDNEYGCHVSECFCETSADAFRTWLQQRYLTLDALNHAWGTTFWGQIYADWDEINPPRSTPYLHNPSQQLDWKRFSSDSLLECFEQQRSIVRAITPNIPLTTNFMGFFKPLDYWKWAMYEDVVTLDCYPDPADPQAAVETAMNYDLMRSVGQGKPWLLMEQVTSHVNWRPQNMTKQPGQMRLWSYQALARGADGIMFFQWRASIVGAEQFHGAMLPHAGTNTRVWREVTALGAELRQLDALVGSEVQAETGILLDWESWWALEHSGKPSADVRLLDQIRAWYSALYGGNIVTDFVHPGADLTRYRLLVAPNLYLLTEQAAHNIQRYVDQGGTLVVAFFSGIANEHAHVWPGGYPAPLRSVLGMVVEEFAPLANGQQGSVWTDDERAVAYDTWADVIRTEGAEPIARFTDGFYAHQPAVTRHQFGQGMSYYVGAGLDKAGIEWVIEQACANAGVAPALAAPEVEVVQRSCGDQSYLFVLNHLDRVVVVPLPRHMRDVLHNNVVEELTLEPRDIAILAEL